MLHWHKTLGKVFGHEAASVNLAKRISPARAPPIAFSLAFLLALPLTLLGPAFSGCASHRTEIPRMSNSAPVAAATVIAFLNRFETLAEKEDFSLIRDLIHERAYFRFNDGDFVGRDAIQAAFEKTWRGDPSIRKARFYLSDITVLTTDHASATATYTFHWEGSQGDQPFTIRGRGTRVLVHEGGQLRIIHEHLSRFPKS